MGLFGGDAKPIDRAPTSGVLERGNIPIEDHPIKTRIAEVDGEAMMLFKAIHDGSRGMRRMRFT